MFYGTPYYRRDHHLGSLPWTNENLETEAGNFSDTLFNFEKFARNVAGYGNFDKNYKSLGTWQVSEIYEKTSNQT